MIYCNYCEHQNQEGAAFCGNCGKPLNTNKNQRATSESCQQSRSKASANGKSWVDSLNDYVGNDRPADLNWKVLFTDVFKKHSVEEAEDIFICGTHSTTPSA